MHANRSERALILLIKFFKIFPLMGALRLSRFAIR